MTIVMGLFHDRKLIDKATAVLKRAGHSFQRVIISAQMGREDELSPDVPLARAVLAAARRVEPEVKVPLDAPDAAAAGGGPEGSPNSQGDFRQLLAERGLAGHQVDGFIKHVLGGHLLAIFTFAEPGAAGPALSVLERMGALRVAQVDGTGKVDEAARVNSMPMDVDGPGLPGVDSAVAQGEGTGTPGG